MMTGWGMKSERQWQHTHTHTHTTHTLKEFNEISCQSSVTGHVSINQRKWTDRQNERIQFGLYARERKKDGELLPSFSRSCQIRTLSKCKYTTLIIIIIITIICNKTVCIDLQRWKTRCMHISIILVLILSHWVKITITGRTFIRTTMNFRHPKKTTTIKNKTKLNL